MENILFVKFIIFNINFNLIFIIFVLFIYILSYNQSSTPKHNYNNFPLYLNRNTIWPFLAVRSAH